MTILGISCYYHDSAAAIIVDGKIIAAAQEERFSRKKHDSSFPRHAINFCLTEAGINNLNIDYVVFYEKPFKKFHRILISNLSTYPRSAISFREAMRTWMTKKLYIKSEIAGFLDIAESKILFSGHHLSHAASAFYPSPFENAAIMTVDGVGEWATASCGYGIKNKIKILKEIYYPQSLGLLYSVFTAFLGFEVNEGEWKVMGLAPYGKPEFTDKIWKIVRALKDGSFALDFSYFSYQYSENRGYSRKFIELFGSPVPPGKSHIITDFNANIASSIQKVTEELLLNMAKILKQESGLENLCFSGGVALNSVANYKLLEKSGFKNIYIAPAPGDSGGAIGAALYAYHHAQSNKKRFLQKTAYLGKSYSIKEIEDFLKSLEHPLGVAQQFPRGVGISKLSNPKLVDYISSEIAKGKVIGWFQGKFEWGPRALGNRSILADPRNPQMKNIINAKVKFREAFRPFAPSVLAGHATKIFDLSVFSHLEGGKLSLRSSDSLKVDLKNHLPLRFMQYVVPVKKTWQKKVPAITHADNSARPQLVFKEDNPLYYSLINSLYKKTGVPLILNTSFNLKGEPIVASPADAYSTFTRSGIDILVMGNYVVRKND